MDNPKKTKDQLAHSRPLDVHKACYQKEFWDLQDMIWNAYIQPLKNYNSTIGKRHLQKILIDLYHAWFLDPALCIAVSFNNNDYTLITRYNKIKITKKSISVIKDLIHLNLLHHKPGMPPRQDYRFGPSYTSRIWPTDMLISHFTDIKFNPLNIRSHDIDKETIILTKKVSIPRTLRKPTTKAIYKTVPIDYSDTPKIRAMRLIMACYNELLRSSHVDIVSAEKGYVSSFNEWGEERRCFIIPHCFVHRRYSDSTFNKGGRIYGGWWERCSSNHKKDIYINGNPTLEVSYNSILLDILYHMESPDSPVILGGQDIYDVSIPELDNVPDSELKNYSREHLTKFKRFLITKLTLFGLNKWNEPDLWKATRKTITAEDKNPESRIKRPPPNILKTISDDFLASVFINIRKKHGLISHHFFSGITSKLQLIDSNIALNLIEHFTALKVPILTVHDSYIIEKRWGQTLINAMQTAWMEEMFRIRENPSSKPKRSKFLHRLTGQENLHLKEAILAEPIEYDNLVDGYSSDQIKLNQIGSFLSASSPNLHVNNSLNAIYQSYWHQWHAEIIKIKTSNTKITPTLRYQISLKRHQDWLQEKDLEIDSPDYRQRYENFKTSININLYHDWEFYEPFWHKKERQKI